MEQNLKGSWYVHAIIDGLIDLKKIMIGASDCEFYRNAANVIRTPDSLIVDGNVGIGTISPSAKLAINGGVNVGADTNPGDNNLYVVNDCSALSFTDRTPYYKGNALSEIEKIKSTENQIDHNTLPEFVKTKIMLKDDKGNIEEIEGRNLGNMISMHTVAIQQLLDKIDKLENKILALEV